jgi:hypothetical protein
MTDDYEPDSPIRPMAESQMREFFAEQDAKGVQGVWRGAGAERLGLSGAVTPEDRGVMFFSDDSSAALREHPAAPTYPTPPAPPVTYPTASAPIPAPEALYPQPSYATPVYQPLAYAASPPRGMSIAGMVLGIASVFFGLVLVVPAIGAILSIIGLRREPAGRGMAITGLVLNGLFLVGWLLLAVMGFGLFGLIFAGAATSSTN